MVNDNTRSALVNQLITNWVYLVESGEFTEEEMMDSLEEQISEYVDTSMDELNPNMTHILGWDLENISDEQADEWLSIVNSAAKAYLNMKRMYEKF